jgi:transcriptional regulator with XRE-family HTH domain
MPTPNEWDFKIMKNDVLSYTQCEALVLLAAGYTDEEVAAKTVVAKSTIARWRKSPEFERLLKQAQLKYIDSALAELVKGAKEAVKELNNIITDPDVPSRTKVSAISVLLTHIVKMREMDLEERLERIEVILDGNHQSEIAEIRAKN